MDLRGGGCSCFAASAQRPLPHPGVLRRGKREARECPEPSSVPGLPASAERPGHPLAPQRAVSWTQPPHGVLPALVLARQPQTVPSLARPGRMPDRNSRVEVGSPGAPPGWGRNSPRDAQGAAQSGALSGEDEKGGDKPDMWERGLEKPEGPVQYSGNTASSVLIRSAHYLVPSLPGMTREGEEKPGKAPELYRGPHPFHTPRPSFLPSPEAKSLALGLCLLWSPRRGGGGPRCAQMLAIVKSTKGLPVLASPLASLSPRPIRRAPRWTRQRTRARGHDRELGQAGAVREPGETAVVRAGE